MAYVWKSDIGYSPISSYWVLIFLGQNLVIWIKKSSPINPLWFPVAPPQSNVIIWWMVPYILNDISGWAFWRLSFCQIWTYLIYIRQHFGTVSVQNLIFWKQFGESKIFSITRSLFYLFINFQKWDFSVQCTLKVSILWFKNCIVSWK